MKNTYNLFAKPTLPQDSLTDVGVSQQRRQDSFTRLATGIISNKDNQSNRNHSVHKQSHPDQSNKSLWVKIIALPAYYWVLIVQLIVILPHALYMPIWLIGYGVISTVAQLPQVKSLRFATRIVYQTIQIVGFAIGLILLWISFGGTFGVDLGIGFLLLCLVSKLWELYKRRDAYVLLNLALFVLAALLLLDQGLSTTLITIVGVLVTLLAMISLNDDNNIDGSGRLRSLMLLAGQAIPLLVILFLFFPRLPPLWSLQLSGQQATTGVSDTMSPGDFSNLSKSTELAFRVEFNDTIPNQSQLYWRGLVFGDFDGMTWSRSGLQESWYTGDAPRWMQMALSTVNEGQENSADSYDIILEPTQQSWLYGLDYPLSQEDNVAITSVFTLQRQQPVTQQYRYNVMRYTDMRIDLQLNEQQRAINLALPSRGNEQTRAFAQQMFAEAGSDPARYINTIHDWINNNEFYYTLSPPLLGENRIDEFLFKTQSGFCEHYSSSFTFLMRAVGIPARVVAGYQGGQVGRDGTSWEVRQMDAHAWSEVWLDGQGWVRIDPTAFVAPMRIEQGMDAFTEQQGASAFGEGATAQFDYQRFRWGQSLRRLSDQIGYYWQKDIVGYDQDKQSESLFKWFNIKNLMQQMLWMIGAVIVIMVIIIGLIRYRWRRKWHSADIPLILLSNRMEKADNELGHQAQEGLLAWLQRLEMIADNDEAKQMVTQVKQQYRKLRYGRLSDMDVKSRDYQHGLKRLRHLAKQIK